MAASGRTEVVNDVKFGVGSYSGPNLVIQAQTVFKRTRRHDGDDDDGVRGLSQKLLRQFHWIRALKIDIKNLFHHICFLQ